MEEKVMKSFTLSAVVAANVLAAIMVPGGLEAGDTSKDEIISALSRELAVFQSAGAANLRNLEEFDVLDFDVYSNKEWDRFGETHTDDVIVHYPDGHTTTDLSSHIGELQWFVTWMPDGRVKEHPIRFGDGEYTGVIGVMEGTFSKPMVLPDGTIIAPTGKSVKMQMVTIGHWTSTGQMDEEWLFWDNAEFNRQIGLSG
jgi:hypothetical protein